MSVGKMFKSNFFFLPSKFLKGFIQTSLALINMLLSALTTVLEERLIAEVEDLCSSKPECDYLTEWELTSKDHPGALW